MAAIIPAAELVKAVESGQASTLTQLAQLFDVTPSAISQALETVGVSLDKTSGEDLSETHRLLDSGYDDLELTLQQKLSKSVTFLTDPLKIARILATVNTAKRRGGPLQKPQSDNTKQVTVLMPGAFNTKVVLNQNKEVTEVDGRTLVTMPSSNVSDMLQEKKKAAEERKNKFIEDSKKPLGELL